MTPSQILSRLDRRFDFLVNRRRDARTRHRTLKAAVEWSYQLLLPEAQRFFAQLSVFRGGWTLEAAEKICEEPLALEYLAQLTDCSLVMAEEADEGMRYRMLEMLREYGQEQLGDKKRAALGRRHAEYYVKLAEEVEPRLKGPKQAAWLNRLEIEHDNFRLALEWSLKASGNIEMGVRLAGGLSYFWLLRGYWSEGLGWLEVVLARNSGVPVKWKAKASKWAGDLAEALGNYDQAKMLYDQSSILFTKLNNKRGLAN